MIGASRFCPTATILPFPIRMSATAGYARAVMIINSFVPDTRRVFSGLLTIAIIGFMFDRAILGLSSVLCRWYFRQADEFRTAA
jgi:ABC-type nitrate/sulfonate/bicarbonate transport system permease component